MSGETNIKKENLGFPGVPSKPGGFTLIELLVVVAIISLLSSIALIAFMSARQKSRNVKRLSDITQMNTALELYFTLNRGYPSPTAVNSGVPSDLVPTAVAKIPIAPTPPDGGCDVLTDPLPVPAGTAANTYFYYPSGTFYVLGGKTLYPDFAYYFCLGNTTGNFGPGIRILTPSGVK